MYNGIKFPLGREQANRSPASPRDSRQFLPAAARQRTEDHGGPKIVDPARRAHQPPPRRPASFPQTCQGLKPGWLAPADAVAGGVCALGGRTVRCPTEWRCINMRSWPLSGERTLRGVTEEMYDRVRVVHSATFGGCERRGCRSDAIAFLRMRFLVELL